MSVEPIHDTEHQWFDLNVDPLQEDVADLLQEDVQEATNPLQEDIQDAEHPPI